MGVSALLFRFRLILAPRSHDPTDERFAGILIASVVAIMLMRRPAMCGEWTAVEALVEQRGFAIVVKFGGRVDGLGSMSGLRSSSFFPFCGQDFMGECVFFLVFRHGCDLTWCSQYLGEMAVQKEVFKLRTCRSLSFRYAPGRRLVPLCC